MDVVVRVARDCVRRRELGAQPRRRSGLEADDPGRRVAALGGMTELRRQPVVGDDAVGIGAGDPDVRDVAPTRSEAGGDRCGAGGAGATPRALDRDDPRVRRRRAAGALGRAVSTAVGGDDREDVHIGHEGRRAVDRAQAGAYRRDLVARRDSDEHGGDRKSLQRAWRGGQRFDRVRTSFERPLAVGAGDRRPARHVVTSLSAVAVGQPSIRARLVPRCGFDRLAGPRHGVDGRPCSPLMSGSTTTTPDRGAPGCAITSPRSGGSRVPVPASPSNVGERWPRSPPPTDRWPAWPRVTSTPWRSGRSSAPARPDEAEVVGRVGGATEAARRRARRRGVAAVRRQAVVLRRGRHRPGARDGDRSGRRRATVRRRRRPSSRSTTTGARSGMRASATRAPGTSTSRVAASAQLGPVDGYVERAGFWHGGDRRRRLLARSGPAPGRRPRRARRAAATIRTCGRRPDGRPASVAARVDAAGRGRPPDRRRPRTTSRRRRAPGPARAGGRRRLVPGRARRVRRRPGRRRAVLRPDHARAVADLTVYVRQLHHGRDAAAVEVARRRRLVVVVTAGRGRRSSAGVSWSSRRTPTTRSSAPAG